MTQQFSTKKCSRNLQGAMVPERLARMETGEQSTSQSKVAHLIKHTDFYV